MVLGIMTQHRKSCIGDSLVVYMAVSVGATRDEMETMMTAAET